MDWILPPDWTQPLEQRLEWLTEVHESYNATEQRIGYRMRPRCTFSWRCTARDDTARGLLENLLSAGQAQSMNLPIWPDVVVAGSSIPSGTSTLNFDTTGLAYSTGARVGLLNGLSAEFGIVQSIAGSSITLTAPLTNTWPAGTLILPLLPARMTGVQRLSSPWPAVSQLSAHWEIDAPWQITPATEAAAYRGYPVLNSDASWSEGVSADYARHTDVVDNGAGPRAVLDRSEIPAVRRSHRWVGISRAERAAFIAWAGARYGRRVPLWLPSGQRDLAVLDNIGASATVLAVEDRSYAGTAAGNVGRRDILIETNAGVRYYRRILSATPSTAGRELINIDNALGAALAPADIAAVSFMRLSRLESDAMEIRHIGPEMAEANYAFVSLRDLS